MKTTVDCAFCAIIADEAPASIVRRWDTVIAIRPRHPVTPGHVLVIPHQHVADIGSDPMVTAAAAAAAAELAAELPACNVITSRGSEATQTVFHLHLHVVPRVAGDALLLPWTGQVKTQKTEVLAA